MTSKHTPGPWKAEDTNGAMLTKVVVAPGDANGSTAVIGNCGGPEKEANARLIAAAPDLLAALQGIVSTCEVRIDDKRIVHFNAAHAAIAKAIGG